ncbi:MAG: methyltransferase [Candidatus Micrarchaeota archaeon]
MRKGKIERAQLHYISGISIDEYKKSNDYKKMRKLFELCGTGHKILDIGSGGGYIGSIIKDNGNDVTCLDLQEEAVRDARKK